MATPQQYFTDYLDDFRGGVDTNTPPRSLILSKLSFGLNLSLRGRFATARPPVAFINIIDPNGLLPALAGIFQGAAYYKPDSGPESLFLSVSGRLFQLTPDNLGNATLQERTIPGDPDSSTTLQVWMWQAENFLIINDGINLPIFFDGTTTRRSVGRTTTTIANVSANFTAPAVGANVVINTVAPYNGAIGVDVVINGDTYEVIASGTTGGTSFVATLLETSNTPSGTVSNGTFITPSAFYAFPFAEGVLGSQASPWDRYTTAWPPPPSNLPIPQKFIQSLTITRPFTGQLYSVLYLNGRITGFQAQVRVGVAGISADGKTLQLVQFTNTQNSVAVDTTLPIQGSQTITWSNAMAFTGSFTTSPAGSGASFTLNVTNNYTGPVGGYLYLSLPAIPGIPARTAEFQLTNFSASGVTYTLTLQNVNAIMGTNYVAPLQITSQGVDLPAGRMGTYGQGRVWMALTDGASFIGGDLVGSSSGTAQYQFRDAVLKITQNITLAGGVNFRIPSSGDTIRAMTFPAQLDASLGQGPLAVFTDFSVYSCLAPTDATTWANLTTPILPSALSGAGGKSQNAVVLSNADIIFRSNTRNIRSLLLARLDFNQWGDTPVSTEMIRFLQGDDQALLTFSTGIEFDNRILMSCRPTSSGNGVYHLGMVAVNFDTITTLDQKSPSVWEGLWTAFNVFQFVKGSFGGIDRAFAFVFDLACATTQLFELLPESSPQIYDSSDFGQGPITFGLETSDLFRGQEDADLRVFKALEDGEIAVDQVLGLVTFNVFYKNDQSPQWTPWRTFSVHVNEALPNAQPGYYPRLGFGKPDELPTNDGLSSQNTRFGHTFQVRIIVSGQCRILGGRFRASLQPEPEFQTPIDNTQPVPIVSDQVVEVDDFSIYNLNNDMHPCGGPPTPPPPVPPPRPCPVPTSFPSLLLPITAGTNNVTLCPTTGALWIPDTNSAKVYVVSTPVPVLLATVDLSAFVSAGPQPISRVVYDSVNDQMMALSVLADAVFINPHSFAVTGNIIKVVANSTGNGVPWASYDSRRGNFLVHYALDVFEANPMPLALVSGVSRSILLTSTFPAIGPLGTALGQSVYVPASDVFYFGNVNTPQIQTFDPVSGAIGFGPLSVGIGFFVGLTRYIPELGLVMIGVADTASTNSNFIQAWNPLTNALGPHLSGADVTNPFFESDLVYNPCTNTLYTCGNNQILKFNASTYAELAKIVLSGPTGMVYVSPQNVVWVANSNPGTAQVSTIS